jgi:hypothetical protein
MGIVDCTIYPLKRVITITASFLLLALSGFAHAISVSISDTYVVLDSSQQRSGKVQLLSMGSNPVEFDVQLAEPLDGVPNGTDYLRWAPSKMVVPGNTSRPLRMVFRPPADLAPGEYIAQFKVTSRQAASQPNFEGDREDRENDQSGLGVGVAIQPVLPVTVYMRHKVHQPRLSELSITGFEVIMEESAPRAKFSVTKREKDISFFGAVALVGEFSGEVLSKSRFRVGHTVDNLDVQLPISKPKEVGSQPLCLHFWGTLPGRGDPDKRLCGE